MFIGLEGPVCSWNRCHGAYDRENKGIDREPRILPDITRPKIPKYGHGNMWIYASAQDRSQEERVSRNREAKAL